MGKDIYYYNSSVIEYAQYVKDICQKKHIPYCDVFNEWMKEEYKGWLAEDGLHANSIGHEKIYKVFKDFLIKFYEE